MKEISFRSGNWGAMLGMLVGVVELSFGSYIRPWIGNKENPVVLGLVTLILSGLAWITVRMARKYVPGTADGKLAIVLGVLVPAGVCFTTVGVLWYLPGVLLLASVSLRVADLWRNRSRAAIHPWRWVSGLGALINLLAFWAAFRRDGFGLFWTMIPVRSDRFLIEILPFDILQRTVYTAGVARVETFESSTVMVVYLLFVLGTGISLIASLASSRLFTRIGGGISLAGMMFFLWQLPLIFLQANIQNIAPLWISLGWGWYLSSLGSTSILLGAFWQHPESGMILRSNSLHK